MTTRITLWIGVCSALITAGPIGAQVAIAPSPLVVPYTLPDSLRSQIDRARAEANAGPAPRDFFQGTAVSGAVGKFGQLAVATKAVRIGIYGKPQCDNTKVPTTCTKRVAYQFEIQSQVVDALNESVAALKQYLLSDKGSPLTLHLPSIRPLSAFDFNTNKISSVPQSWTAGALSASVRYIPVRDTSNDIVSAASAAIHYTLEAHLRGDVGGVDGTTFAVLTPSINWPLGRALKTQIVDGNVSRIVGVSYQVGYQFGTANAVSASGTYSFKSLKDGRRQLNLAFARVLGALASHK